MNYHLFYWTIKRFWWRIRGFAEIFVVRFGISNDSVLSANDLGWTWIPNKGFPLITIKNFTTCPSNLWNAKMFTTRYCHLMDRLGIVKPAHNPLSMCVLSLKSESRPVSLLLDWTTLRPLYNTTNNKTTTTREQGGRPRQSKGIV